ncbi:MAG TPA: type II toxin-antitoxin system Phd/YefM family antitoxin [Terriglobales bacterium]|nr:type II toxin-antitoxin system Phd/YefM family antitoxin [Terriglobales bacterium]
MAAPRMNASAARENFADIVNRVAYRGERVIVRRHNRDVAAVIPIEDLELLQRVEDHMDIKDALKALREPRGKTSKQLKAELGL